MTKTNEDADFVNLHMALTDQVPNPLDVATAIAALIDAKLAGRTTGEEPPAWRCSCCGELMCNEMPDTSWRWNGTAWEHWHGQGGYFVARNFASPPASPVAELPDVLPAGTKSKDGNELGGLRRRIVRTDYYEGGGHATWEGNIDRSTLHDARGGERAAGKDPDYTPTDDCRGGKCGMVSHDEAHRLSQRAGDEAPPSSPLESLAYAIQAIINHLRSAATPSEGEKERKACGHVGTTRKCLDGWWCCDCGAIQEAIPGKGSCWESPAQAIEKERKAPALHTCTGASGLTWQPCEECRKLYERGEHWTQKPGAFEAQLSKETLAPVVEAGELPGVLPETLPDGAKLKGGASVAGWKLKRPKPHYEDDWENSVYPSDIDWSSIDRSTLHDARGGERVGDATYEDGIPGDELPDLEQMRRIYLRAHRRAEQNPRPRRNPHDAGLRSLAFFFREWHYAIASNPEPASEGATLQKISRRLAEILYIPEATYAYTDDPPTLELVMRQLDVIAEHENEKRATEAKLFSPDVQAALEFLERPGEGMAKRLHAALKRIRELEDAGGKTDEELEPVHRLQPTEADGGEQGEQKHDP